MDFNNNTNVFICRFNEIECWNENDNRFLYVWLLELGLKGEFPHGVIYCTSVTGVEIFQVMSSIEFFHQLSGIIPANLANCSNLHVLKLGDKQLSGQISPELALLSRIKTFTVTNNQSCGPVPQCLTMTSLLIVIEVIQDSVRSLYLIVKAVHRKIILKLCMSY